MPLKTLPLYKVKDRKERGMHIVILKLLRAVKLFSLHTKDLQYSCNVLTC